MWHIGGVCRLGILLVVSKASNVPVQFYTGGPCPQYKNHDIPFSSSKTAVSFVLMCRHQKQLPFLFILAYYYIIFWEQMRLKRISATWRIKLVTLAPTAKHIMRTQMIYKIYLCQIFLLYVSIKMGIPVYNNAISLSCICIAWSDCVINEAFMIIVYYENETWLHNVQSGLTCLLSSQICVHSKLLS